MNCPRCGKQLEQNTKFCSSCGEKISSKSKTKTIIFLVISAIIIVVLAIFLIGEIEMLGDINERDDGLTEVVRDNELVTVKDLNIMIPVKFVSYKDTKLADNWKAYHVSSTTNDCDILISASKLSETNSTDEKTYIKEEALLRADSKYSEVEEKEINNKKWYTMSVEETYGTKEYYYVIYNNSLAYKVKYSISKDSGTCSSDYEKIINSMKFNGE